MMANATGGNDSSGAPEPMFKVGDKVVVEGQEDKDSIIKEVHFTGDIVNNSWKYLVHKEKIQAMTSKPVVSFGIQDEGGTLKTIEKAVRAARDMASEAAMQQKEVPGQ